MYIVFNILKNNYINVDVCKLLTWVIINNSFITKRIDGPHQPI